MLTKKTLYGLKAVLYLAQRPKDAVLISDISKDEKIPKKFLESILLELKNKGFLYSKKGKGGGYFLAHSTLQTSLGTLIRVLDGPLAPVPCVSQTAYRPCEECVSESLCGIRMVMKDVRDAMSNILDFVKVEDIVKKVEAATRGTDPHTYCI